MQFSELPQSWTCPQCQSPKPYFESQMLTIAGAQPAGKCRAKSAANFLLPCLRGHALHTRSRSRVLFCLRVCTFVPHTHAGFAENQNYGFGGNGMTEGQKSNVIFGGLFAGFLLLMSGYLLT